MYKAGIISETVKNLKIERKLLLTAYIKSYTGFRLPPKCMTLNDLWARFKVIDSLNASKMAKYRLVMTLMPCRVAGCVSVKLSCTYLLSYLHSWLGRMKPAISLKRLKIERKLLLTAYTKSYTGFRLPPKCMTLNDLWAYTAHLFFHLHSWAFSAN